MSVIVVEHDRIWGASSALIYSIIEYAIEIFGEKDNLMEYRSLYDDGYRTMSLVDASIGEAEEFRNLVVLYKRNVIYKRFSVSDEEAKEIDVRLSTLIEMIDTSISKRSMM